MEGYQVLLFQKKELLEELLQLSIQGMHQEEVTAQKRQEILKKLNRLDLQIEKWEGLREHPMELTIQKLVTSIYENNQRSLSFLEKEKENLYQERDSIEKDSKIRQYFVPSEKAKRSTPHRGYSSLKLAAKKYQSK